MGRVVVAEEIANALVQQIKEQTLTLNEGRYLMEQAIVRFSVDLRKAFYNKLDGVKTR